MGAIADDQLLAALSALRLEPLAGPLAAAGLDTLAALEEALMASRTAFLSQLKDANVGTLPLRQALANGLGRRLREGDLPVWLRPGDACLFLSPWNWQARPALAVSAAAGAYLRVHWRGATLTAPSLAIDAPANQAQPILLTATYDGHPPVRLRVRASADGLMPLPPPPRPAGNDRTAAHSGGGGPTTSGHHLTLQMESIVQSSERWGTAAGGASGSRQSTLPADAFRLRGVVLPPGSLPLPPRVAALTMLAFGDSITEGVMARRREATDVVLGDLATTSTSSSERTKLPPVS